MKIEKRLVHFLPLAAIVILSTLAFVGVVNTLKGDDADAKENGLSMTISGDLDFEITPEIGGTYAEKTLNVSVSTTNRTGYSLMFESKYDTNAESKTEDGVIASVANPIVRSNMPVNSWGFYVGTDNWIYPIPEKNSPITIASTTNSVTNDTTNVTVGVKVAPSLKSGEYENALIFTALANEVDCGDGFFCIDTMQEMTPAVCSATTTPLDTATEITYEYTTDNTKIPRTVLRDTRDDKYYLVSKHADGKCWMSQNLDLVLSTSQTLTAADTDLHSVSSWTPGYGTATSADGYQVGDSLLGKSYRSSVKYLRGGITPSNTPSTNDGRSNWESVGVYYNWVAATAGSARSIIENEEDYAVAQDSICPRGWQLPETWENSGWYSDVEMLSYAYLNYSPFSEQLGFISSQEIYVDGVILKMPQYNNEDISPYGVYWSSRLTSSYNSNASAAVVESTYSGFSAKPYYEGASIRCVARRPLYNM